MRRALWRPKPKDLERPVRMSSNLTKAKSTYMLNYVFIGGDPMGQVTIYLDAETENTVRKITKKKGISKSKWIAELIREKTSSTWPERIVGLAGAWADLPTAAEIRKTMGRDARRETI